MLDLLITILITIESNGNPNAIGDGGKAVGILQIHKSVVDDVNRIYGTKYSYEDREDVEKSKEIAYLYLGHWGAIYFKKVGKTPTLEIYARIWNGGAQGWKKQSTLKYWEKVKKAMSEKGGGFPDNLTAQNRIKGE